MVTPNRSDIRNSLIPTLSLARQGDVGVQPMVTGGSAPQAPAPWQPPASGMLEEYLGTDLDPSAISPREVHRFYSDPRYGKDEATHLEYVANAEKLLDQQLIPWGEAPAFYSLVGAQQGQDLTLRQYLALSPVVALETAMADYKSAEKGSAEEQQAKARLDAVLADVDRHGPVADPANLDAHPIAAQAWGQLTGRNPQWDSPTGRDVAGRVLGALRSGMTGGKFEDDPSISPEEFAQLQEKYGEEANRMLTPGGVKNAKREAAFDFLAALQDVPGANPHIDNFSNVMGIVGAQTGAGGFPTGLEGVTRADALMDPSAYRGRMWMANDRFGRALKSFDEYDANPERPYVVQADNFNRLDTGSYMGLLNAMGSSSWGYGRNIGNPFKPVFGELVTRSHLKDDFADQRPLQFFQDVLDRTQRETPIRLPGESYGDSRTTRNFVADRRAAAQDYLPTHARPAIADAVNAFGAAVHRGGVPHDVPRLSRNPRQFEAVGYGLPQAIVESPIQMGMFAPGAFAKPLQAMTVGMANETIQENIEDRIQNPANQTGPFETRKQSAWMRPNLPGSLVTGPNGEIRRRTMAEYQAMQDADNVQAWQQGVQETNDNRTRELEDQYQRWLRFSSRANGQ